APPHRASATTTASGRPSSSSSTTTPRTGATTPTPCGGTCATTGAATCSAPTTRGATPGRPRAGCPGGRPLPAMLVRPPGHPGEAVVAVVRHRHAAGRGDLVERPEMLVGQGQLGRPDAVQHVLDGARADD